MAYNARKIAPTDFKPNVGVGINFTFSSPGVFNLNYENKEAVKNNLINFFLTEPGERLDNPTFGGGLRSYVFENINSNTLEGLEDFINDKISLEFSNIILEELQVLGLEDSNSLKIIIKYSILDQQISDTIELNFG